MSENTVGVRELKAHFSSHLRRVKAGGTVVITERGKPVGRIVPVAPSLEEKLKGMVRSGLAHWDGTPLGPPPPRPRVKGPKLVSDLLLEDRE